MLSSGEIKKNIADELKSTHSVHEVDLIWRTYVGRKGSVSAEVRGLKDLPPQERKTRGKQLNQLKAQLNTMFKRRLAEIEAQDRDESVAGEWLDVTRPSTGQAQGTLHPITRILQETEDVFGAMGFDVVEGPQIESEWYNFDALNIPPEHPARDLQDTFWLKDANHKNNKPSAISHRPLLRTHTSPMQIRYMQEHNPPLRIVVPGRVFRYEATDASHHYQFYQLEGLMIDKEISVANFKAVIEEFYRTLFKTDVSIRLRPSYFPFVEPGFEVDMSCVSCNRKGCSVCSQTGWLEMMGAGMVHPKVFKAAGYNPKHWTGFAFGMGLDRLAMMKYKIDDVRLLYSGDLRFLKQFR